MDSQLEGDVSSVTKSGDDNIKFDPNDNSRFEQELAPISGTSTLRINIEKDDSVSVY